MADKVLIKDIFSTRIKNRFLGGYPYNKGLDLLYAEDLTQFSSTEIIRHKNIGYKSLYEIVYKLDKLNLYLKDGITVKKAEKLYRIKKSIILLKE